MKSFNAFISTSEERTNKCPSNIPNTQGSFSILLNLTAYSPQPPLESLFFLGILLCNTIPVVYYLGNSFPGLLQLVLSLPGLYKYWVSHWPSLLDIPGSFHSFKPSFMSQWFSNFHLHENCTSDLQTPTIHSSPFPGYFTGTPKQKFSKMTSPSPNMSLCQLSPSWYMTLFRDKNLYLSSVSAIPPPPPHTAEGWTYPSPSEILSQLPSPSLSWIAYNSFLNGLPMSALVPPNLFFTQQPEWSF